MVIMITLSPIHTKSKPTGLSPKRVLRSIGIDLPILMRLITRIVHKLYIHTICNNVDMDFQRGNIMKTLNTVTTQTRATKAIARATKLKVVEYKNTKRSLVLPMEGLILPCLSQEAKEMQDFVTGVIYSGAKYERAYKKYTEEFNKSIVSVYEEYCTHKLPLT